MDLLVIVPVAAALLGSLVGAVGSYLANRRMWDLKQKRQERRVARALQGEIEAIVRIVDWRDYPTGLRSAAQDFRRGEIAPFMVPIEENYFAVFEAHTEQLGALKGDLPRRVAEVYTLSKAIVDDFKGIAGTDWKQFASDLQQLRPEAQQVQLEDTAEKFVERADFIDQAMKIAAETATQLDDAYGIKS